MEGTSSSETSIHNLKTRRSKRYVINVPYGGRALVRESSFKLKADRSYSPHQDKFSRRSNKRCFQRRLPFISKQYIKAERKIEHYRLLQILRQFPSFSRRDHLWPEISRMYLATENVSKTKYKTLICYFKNNKTRLMLESSCDPVKLQYGSDFEAVYKCESATIRMVGGGRVKSRLGSKGDPINKKKLSSILGKYSGFKKSGKQIWTFIALEYFGTNHINRKKRMQLYNFFRSRKHEVMSSLQKQQPKNDNIKKISTETDFDYRAMMCSKNYHICCSGAEFHW